jgi:small-conductance mechanosensitive channel
MEDRGLVASLFDLSFTHFITPKIQRFLYGLLLVGCIVAGLAVVVAALGMAGGFFGKMGALLVGVPAGALVFLLLAMYCRVMMEILIVVFRAVDYLRDIAGSVRRGPAA